MLETYSSLTELLDNVKGLRDDDTNTSFYGAASLREAKVWALFERSRHLSQLESARKKITPGEISREDPEMALDVTGRTFDMGLYMSGVPECWISYPSKEPQFYRIFANIGLSFGISAEIAARRGAAVAALVEHIEARGIRVELTVGWDYSNGDDYSAHVRIKDFGEQLDIDRIAFALCDVALSRRIAFNWVATRSGNSGSVGWGKPHVPVGVDLALGRMHANDPHFKSPESAEAWILEQIARLDARATSET